MTELTNLRYRFDPTGQANSNLVVDEIQTVSLNGARLVVAREGVFYTRDFSIRPTNSSTPLLLNVDYHYISMDTEITARTGLETATGIEIDNPALSGDYYITYHAVGGIEGQSNALVADLIEAIEVAKDAPINWNKLLNVPAQFPPEWHPHEVSDLNGLEVVSQALSNLERAILDSRPLQLSGNNLHWQDERILNLISIMMDRINAIYALVLEQDIDALVDAKVAVVEAEYDRKLQIIIGAIDWGPNGPPDLYPDTDPDPDPDEELYPGLNIYDAGGISGPSPVIPGSVIEPDIVDVNGDPNGGTGELYPGDIVYDTGTTLGQSTLIAGAELEPDTVDLNPAP